MIAGLDTFWRNTSRTLRERSENGIWQGRLSSSPLATAVAVGALASVNADAHRQRIENGRRYIESMQNDDGGWGDAPNTLSNLAATVLCWSAMTGSECERAAEAWLRQEGGGIDADAIAAALQDRYGEDRTFSAPILTFAILTGRLPESAWRHVPPLPFELSLLPHILLRLVRLPIVSYALPALIAIGLARHELGQRWPIARLRNLWTGASLRKLARIQPTSGGFLEAAPLSGFVTICLAATGRATHPVTQQAVRFLNDTVRDDGSWAIDTTLNGWVTSLAGAVLTTETDTRTLRRWTLDRQARQTHPYTQSPAGGWSWTDLPGGVPDVDDTAAALKLLHAISPQPDDETHDAAVLGVRWLLGIQNGDGGFPTFCKGWGKLPFDRSCSDLTAHAISALTAWRDELPAQARKINRAVARAVNYLQATQRHDGAFLPMWFGSEQTPDESNPVYGTARVLIGLRSLDNPPADVCDAARVFLESQQNVDGSFGPAAGVPGSIEETAVALEAMVRSGSGSPQIESALEWLAQATEHGTRFPASPIGLYFARLWYAEELYPLVFTASALQAIRSAR